MKGIEWNQLFMMNISPLLQRVRTIHFFAMRSNYRDADVQFGAFDEYLLMG